MAVQTEQAQSTGGPSFCRLRNRGNAWGVRIPKSMDVGPGETVSVTTRAGKTREVVLAAAAKSFEDATLFEIRPKGDDAVKTRSIEVITAELTDALAAKAAATSEQERDQVENEVAALSKELLESQQPQASKPKKPGVEKPGVFETADGVYIVKSNKAQTGLYALELIELTPAAGDRMNEKGDAVRYRTEYARGKVYELTEADRMPLERGRELTLRYGKCIACGAKLEVKKSLEAGMGPVCRKKFA